MTASLGAKFSAIVVKRRGRQKSFPVRNAIKRMPFAFILNMTRFT
jgi:hypothetical protein